MLVNSFKKAFPGWLLKVKKDEMPHLHDIIHEFSWGKNYILCLRCFIESLVQKILSAANF